MSEEDESPTRHRPDITASTATIPSDSEQYSSSQNELSPSPEPPSDDRSRPLILYTPPTFWSLVRGAAINLLLPFVNGLMLGFGELLAHEAAFRFGWSNTNVGLLSVALIFLSIEHLLSRCLDLPETQERCPPGWACNRG